jgi:hypothetical protein
MPTLRLRKRLLDRLVRGINNASELGLALLITAGVVHCGGDDSGGGTADGAAAQGGGFVVEAAAGGPVIEAAGGGPVVEAAMFPDAGSDVRDAGADGHISPMLEAPSFSDR